MPFSSSSSPPSKDEETTKIIQTRLRTKNTYDPYNGLATSHIPSSTDTSEYWSNGTITHFSTNQTNHHHHNTPSPSFAPVPRVMASSSIISNAVPVQQTLRSSKQLLLQSSKPMAKNSGEAALASSGGAPSSPIDTTSIISNNSDSASNSNNNANAGGVDNEVRNSIIAGSVAGITSCLIFHPFDVIRTKIQATTNLSPISSSSTAAAVSTAATSTATSSSREGSAAILSSTSKRIGTSSSTSSATTTNAAKKVVTKATSKYKGPIATFKTTLRHGGFKSLYTGISLPLAAQAAYKATVMTVNRITKSALLEYKTVEQRKVGIFTPYQFKWNDYFICGAVSGAINACIFVAPVEYVRNQLIHQQTLNAKQVKLLAAKHGGDITLAKKLMKKSLQHNRVVMNGPYDVVRRTLKTNGITGLWRGASVTLIRDSIGCGTFFVCFEAGQRYLPSITGKEQGAFVHTIGSGFMAGFGYWLSSLPLDSLKTLVQTGKSSSAMDTIRVLIKRDGIGGILQLYRGWQLAFSRGSPSAAVTLTTYSTTYDFLGRVLDSP